MATVARCFFRGLVPLLVLWLLIFLTSTIYLTGIMDAIIMWENSLPWPLQTNPPLLILSWTRQTGDLSENVAWHGFKGHDPFAQCHLLETWMRCQYTFDKRRFNASEAVLFRARRLNKEKLPAYRLQNQKWIFYEYESPFQIWKDLETLKSFNKVFNLTSTYSFDSDIPLNLKRNVTIGPNMLYTKRQNNVTYSDKKGRGKLVVWFVSHCKTQSQREIYVKELQNYIPVDIYGQCGPFKCGSNKPDNRSHCDSSLLTEPGSYKFYLSFENSLCNDYVTEKLWGILKQDVLQVVMGGVDYTKYIPPNTYVDVRDFPSPASLASYLHYLDHHPKTYDAFIKRKRSLRTQLLGYNEPYHCRMCRYLHQNRNRTQIVKNMSKFWGFGSRCHSPGVYYKNNSKGVVWRKP